MNVAFERLRAQRLVEPAGSAADVVRHLVAVQSQDYYGACWAVGQRSALATTAESVERAFDAGELLRTHVLRPTWHFVTHDDARWLLELTGPRVQAINATYYKQCGLSARTLARTDTALAKELAGQSLTREELATRLKLGSGLKLVCTMMHAELECAVISGPRRGKKFTYAAFDERTAPSTIPRTRDDALGELARRYVTSHGPARLKDFVWWSGLNVADARRGLESLPRIGELHVAPDRHAALSESAPSRSKATKAPPPLVHLLPNYDELLIAFADRTDAHDERVTKLDAKLLGVHFVVSNGKLLGGYRLERGKQTTVVVSLLAKLSRAERTVLDTAVERFQQFHGSPVALRLVSPATTTAS